ncbi:MAG TPA: biosynthetic-type acetolactate synthase large subunit [Steroidobacteraceae bacterium]|nr:biosynthetic-type acetolactate synthase large subunit [Steroidobacteraceae bacterium]
MNDTAALTDTPAHPLAGKVMTGAAMVVQAIADEGPSAIFGYSGGAVLPCYDAVFLYNEAQGKAGKPLLPLIVPANEQAAGFMAAGYSRSTGQVGVAMVTSGPGATNMVTPVRDCMADSIPMVVVCGQVPRAAIGSDAFQEAPIAAVMGAVAKHVFLVTEPEKLEGTIRAAFELARSGRPGPVVVDIPKDVQNWQGVYQGRGMVSSIGVYLNRTRALAAKRLSAAQLDSFFTLLGRSRRPLIYAGGGVMCANACDELREFSQLFGIPVVTTLMAIGAVDTTQPLSMRMLGMHGTAFANYAVEDCDFLITLGARFDDRVAGNPAKFAPRARAIAQFDIDAAEINKVKPVQWHHVGDLKDSLKSLLAYGRCLDAKADLSVWHAELAALKRDYPMDYDRNSAVIQPYHVIEEINKLTRGEAIISTGVGQHQMWAAQYSDFRGARQWLTSGSMGTMGFGLPAALGAQVAHPGKLVIDIDGDASIRMNIGELETATTYNLPVKVCVLNNIGDGMVRQWQKLFFGGRMASTDKSLHTKDFVKAAQADGFRYAVRLANKADVARVVKEWLEFDGPAFLEVMIDPDAGVYPMVPPGQPYDAMITGDFIRARAAAPVVEKPGASEMF